MSDPVFENAETPDSLFSIFHVTSPPFSVPHGIVSPVNPVPTNTPGAPQKRSRSESDDNSQDPAFGQRVLSYTDDDCSTSSGPSLPSPIQPLPEACQLEPAHEVQVGAPKSRIPLASLNDERDRQIDHLDNTARESANKINILLQRAAVKHLLDFLDEEANFRDVSVYEDEYNGHPHLQGIIDMTYKTLHRIVQGVLPAEILRHLQPRVDFRWMMQVDRLYPRSGEPRPVLFTNETIELPTLLREITDVVEKWIDENAEILCMDL